MSPALISISVVSHGQADLIELLFDDLARLASSARFEVILTCNIAEDLPFSPSDYPFPLLCIDNSERKGFGANHNAAFRCASGDHFCIMNPDIRLPGDPFPALLAGLQGNGVGLVAPLVRAANGNVEDSIRHFPTPFGLAKKALNLGDGRFEIANVDAPAPVDWVAGMFVLVRSEAFRDIGGFDEGFFLYYEDVDLCVRLWKRGWRVMACPSAQVIHDARRQSHRSFRYLRWHVGSLLRYLGKHWLRLPKSA